MSLERTITLLSSSPSGPSRNAEDGITQAKTRALTDLRGVGAEVTGGVLAKVAGLRPPAAQIQAAVDAAMTER